MHELLIGILIIAIVAIQIYVFSITLEKIKIFKNILPSQENFKIVKVFIKESDIETVRLVDIFRDLKKYSDINQDGNLEIHSKNSTIQIKNDGESENVLVLNKDSELTNQSPKIEFIAKSSKKTLNINDIFVVAFIIDIDTDNFTPPLFEGFQIVSGPVENVSEKLIDDVIIYKKKYIYKLYSSKQGLLVIKPASVIFNGLNYKTKSIDINVLKPDNNLLFQ